MQTDRGAPLGKPALLPLALKPIMLRLERIRIDRGGYEADGTYWGLGAPMWRATDAATGGREVSVYVRAIGRGHAKDRVRAVVPDATFFR